MKSKKIRSGHGLKTILASNDHGVFSSSTFFEVDNLDTKTFTEAKDNYEKVFITIRNYLKENEEEQYNLASEAARLTLTQDIVDLLSRGGLIRKEEK